MAKWADYLISAVEYDSNHRILRVMQHTDEDGQISQGEVADRDTLTTNLKHGRSYMTMFSSKDTWLPGDPVHLIKLSGAYSVRTDSNKVEYDNLKLVSELA